MFRRWFRDKKAAARAKWEEELRADPANYCALCGRFTHALGSPILIGNAASRERHGVTVCTECYFVFVRLAVDEGRGKLTDDIKKLCIKVKAKLDAAATEKEARLVRQTRSLIEDPAAYAQEKW